jgi:hypothetical protein
MTSRLTLYALTKQIFIHGVGGEVRNVQPGDELLLQNSSILRQNLIQKILIPPSSSSSSVSQAATSSTTIDGRSNSTTTDTILNHDHDLHTRTMIVFKAAFQWMECLFVGVDASPYSHAFKMDLIEAYRLLGLGKAALHLFTALGVKYIQVIMMMMMMKMMMILMMLLMVMRAMLLMVITMMMMMIFSYLQHDSMSYILLPALMESGLFKEASSQLFAIINFHKCSRRDTLDMLSKAFQFGNYMKVVELHRFVQECSRWVLYIYLAIYNVHSLYIIYIYNVYVHHYTYAYIHHHHYYHHYHHHHHHHYYHYHHYHHHQIYSAGRS